MRMWQMRRQKKPGSNPETPESKELAETVETVRQYRHKRVTSRRIPSRSTTYNFDGDAE